ncbi:DUF3467 domain-containing protein [Candidatus Poribacteria bacterium]|nr:DUF3467 domain-containing protein [Candidatus Poribacteria bacterium]
MSEKENQDKGKKDRIRTVYSNIVRIGHSPYEFMLDFGQYQPEGKKAFMDVRIITSPQHAKAVVKALSENIAKYEQQYGKISSGPGDEDDKDIDTDWQNRRRR